MFRFLAAVSLLAAALVVAPTLEASAERVRERWNAMRPHVPPAPVFQRLAQACLSDSQAWQAVQSGQAHSITDFLPAIRSQVKGQILGTPRLCQVGGRFVYYVSVLTSGGREIRLTVDASTGAVSY